MPNGTDDFCYANYKTKVKRPLWGAIQKAQQLWPGSDVSRHVYQCNDCNEWHITRRSASRGKKHKAAVRAALEKMK